MTVLVRLASIARWILRRDTVERELDEELQVFVDMAAAEKMRDGITPTQARRLAIAELGGLEQAKERVRSGRHGAVIDEIARDVRFAFRMFRRNPGFTAIVVMTLALGIGANTAIFSLIDALMLRWLPVPNAQELVLVTLRSPGANAPFESLSYAIVRALDEQRDVFTGVAGFSGLTFNVGAAGSASKVAGAVVTGAYYETLGLTPQIGRLLAPDDDRSGAAPVAVISDGFWERQFGRGAAAAGQTLLVNNVPVTVVGVSPRGFVGANVGAVADVTMPVAALTVVDPAAAPLLGPGNFWLRALARPRAGVSVSDASTRLSARWPHMAEQALSPRWPASRRTPIVEAAIELEPGGTGWSFLRERYRKPLFVLMAVVSLVLVIACANVASLLLARATARQREMAVRLALGAGRGRIVRQLLIESLLLSVAGAAFGIALAWASSRFLVSLISTGPMPLVFDLSPNTRVLAFTTAVAIATGVLFGLAPAFLSTASGPQAVLKDDGRLRASRSRLLPSLVSAQVALSLVLLVGAGLFVRTLQNLQRLDPGFERDGVLLVDVEGRRTRLPADLVDEIKRVPGVIAASVSTHTPLSGSTWSDPAVPAWRPLPERDTAHFVGAGPGFFATMRIPVRAGRDFTDRDTRESAGVAVVNDAFARRHFPGVNPVGQPIAALVRGERRELEIVGVVQNTKTAGLRAAPPPIVYVVYAQLTGDLPTTLVVRAAGSLGDVAEGLRRTVREKLPGGPVDVRALSAQVDATMARERMMATLATGFGLLALTLASVGLYGLLAYAVVRRTREIGIRMALGARRTRVIALMLRGAARLVAVGLALGLPAAWAASRWIESMLFGLKPADPVTMGAAIALLATAALAAAYLPARRASLVEPLTALRHE